MSEKPNVFPSKEEIEEANVTGDKLANQIAEENNVETTYGSDAESAAAAEMRRRTEEQIRLREENLRKNEEIAKQMDAKRESQLSEKSPPRNQSNNFNQQPPVVPPNNNGGNYSGNNGGDNKPSNESYIQQLSQPQMNQPFDVIPLPSEGKLYPNRKKNVKISFLTTADENILTSPNLLESGDFLEILINRKLLEPDLRYKDLIPGDRNAILIWLRATGYGELYPVVAYDKNNEPFETEVNLSELKTVYLSVDPDSDGLFEYKLPISKNVVKVKMLTVGELEVLENRIESNKDNPINEEQTLMLESQIVSINGNMDSSMIKESVRNMRVGDAQGLRDFMNSIECGVDMNLTLRTPGGESVNTFLPFTPRFFWPNSVV